MNLTRRRLLGSFALGAGAVIVAACGQSQQATPAATSAPAKPAESKPAESKPAESKPAAPAAAGAPTSAPAAAQPAASGGGGPITIAVIAWNSGSSAEAFKNAMAQINDKFKQQKPNVTITF